MNRFLRLSMLMLMMVAVARGQQIASQSNLIPNGSITVDGNVTDWMGIPGFGADPIDDGAGGYDLSQLFIAHDESNYYVRVQLYSDEINFGGSAAGMWTLFDTDKDFGTGLSIFASGLGAEWNGSGVSQFNGWNSAGQHTGSILGSTVAGARDGGQLEYEYSIPRPYLVRIAFMSRCKASSVKVIWCRTNRAATSNIMPTRWRNPRSHIFTKRIRPLPTRSPLAVCWAISPRPN